METKILEILDAKNSVAILKLCSYEDATDITD